MKKTVGKVVLLTLVLICLGTTCVRADEAAIESTTPATTEQTQAQEETPAQEEAQTQDVQNTNEEKAIADDANIKAKIIEAGEIYERENDSGEKETVQRVKIKVLNGDRKDEKFETVFVLTYDIDNRVIGQKLREGQTVYVKIQNTDGKEVVTITDVARQKYLIGLIAFFFASILLVGRKKGLKSIIGLVVTVSAIMFILLVSLFKGYNPVLVSIGTCFLITIITFPIIGGFNKKSLSGALGTVGGVVFAGIIATIFGNLAGLSGAGKEEAIMLSVAAKDITFNFRGLLFAEILVSALGAVMDVAMSVASSLSELKAKKPSMSAKELFKSGMNIGGDMIGTMTNTLILSFIGSSLLLVLLYMAVSMNVADVVNIEAIASEAVCAISGSVGIVYTVPITAAIYAFINRDKDVYKTKPDTKMGNKRTLKL